MERLIEARGLTKRYELGKENYVDALRGASLRIGRGEVVAIMGPSGSGKSTMMHILGCLDAPDAGEVWLSGRRVDGLKGKDLNEVRRSQLGFVFQGFNLIPSLTALDNVALAGEYAGMTRRGALSAAREALEAVGLGDRVKHLPSELSGGQQQRVAIARALVNRPAVLFGDEPTGNLDSASSAEIMELMLEINRSTGTTFVLVTHDEDVAARCDRVVRMRDGEVVTDGIPAAVEDDAERAA
jgi:putative ABC transport system ATP-binding protein